MIQVEDGITRILERTISGKRISKEEAYELAISDSIFKLGEAANKLRKERCGDSVSYVVNRNINFTNICQGTCRFCAYRVSKSSPNSYLLKFDEVVEKTRQALATGATEVCIQGGLNPDLDLEYYVGLLESIKARFNIHIHAFSPMEIAYVSDKSGLGVKETLKVLKEKGLDSMPGTAAEIFDREIREQICPDKISAEDWKHIIKSAHRQGIPTTATMLYGHIERLEHRINHLDTLRSIQDETGGFTEFVPLSFIPYRTPIAMAGHGIRGASGGDDLKIYALSRLYLDNFRNIQASWVKLGKKLAQAALSFGANDMGGTIMEESISTSAGQSVEIMDEEEMRGFIESTGRTPLRRDTLYNPLDV